MDRPPGRIHHVRRTSRLVLLLGIFLAALTFVVVLFLGNNNQTPPGQAGPSAPPTQLATVLAAVDIPLGTVVTQDMLKTQTIAVPSREVNVLGDVSQGVGKTTRTNITAGAQVHSNDFQYR